MGRLLPSGDSSAIARSDEPTVVFLDDDRADDVISAVQSETARDVLRELLKEPRTPSEVGARLDMSVESVSYHIQRLLDRDLITAHDRTYSEKGREMTVYGVAEDPLFIVFGSSENASQLREVFSQLAAAIGPVAVLLAIRESLTDPLDLLELLTT